MNVKMQITRGMATIALGAAVAAYAVAQPANAAAPADIPTFAAITVTARAPRVAKQAGHMHSAAGVHPMRVLVAVAVRPAPESVSLKIQSSVAGSAMAPRS